MDPVTAVGLVASIVQLISIITQVIKCLSDINDAPKDRKKLVLEVNSLLTLLTNLRFEAQEVDEAANPDRWFNNLCLLGVEAGPFDQFKAAMEQVLQKLKPESGLKKFRSALVWPLDKKEVISSLAQIERLKSSISIALGRDHFHLSLAIKQDVQKIQEDHTNYQIDHANRILLDWLSPLDFFTTQNDIFSKLQEGTGNWFTDSDKFLKWKSEKVGVLWCPGIPGAGKTVLTSKVIHHIQKSGLNHDIGLAFIYFNYKEQTEQTSTSLVGSLLRQLAQDQISICADLKIMYEDHKKNKSKPSFDEVSNALCSAAGRFSQVFIILDALDECSGLDGCRDKMLKLLNRLSCVANVMVTSRPNTSIEQGFNNVQQLEIIASDGDVRLCLEARILDTPRLHRIIAPMPSLEKNIVDTISAKAQGMLLLAQFHMDSITTKATRNAIQKALKDLPMGLKNTYEEVMRRIHVQNGDDRDLAMRVLLWIIYAVRPLTVKELQHALAITPGTSDLDEGDIIDEETILFSCAGIVTIDHESRIIRLVHYTAQEYFERFQTELFPKAQHTIVRACLTYLSFDVVLSGLHSEKSVEIQLEKNLFLGYAAENWAEHERRKTEDDDDDDDLVLNFLMDDSKVGYSSHIMMGFKSRHPTTYRRNMFFGGHLAAYFGLDKHIKRFLKNQIALDAKDNDGRTPLSYAAGNGHEAVVKMLLGSGKPAVVESKDLFGQTPFFWAAQKGREVIVRLFLKRDDININSKNRFDETPILRAIQKQHKIIVELLLGRDDLDVNSKDCFGNTPLFLAAENNNEALFKLLIERDHINVDSQNNSGQSPLLSAVRRGSTAMVELLLERGADPNILDFWDQTPLLHTAEYNHEAVVKILLEWKADVNVADFDGRTPWSYAMDRQNEAIKQMLLDHGAEAESAESRNM